MGSGFRTFQSGEVLTSSNVQNYLMDQSVMVFAGTAARSSAITSPEEGMITYDTVTDLLEVYNGSKYKAFAGMGTATTSGSILQAVSTTKTDTFSTTSTAYTDITGLSVSITPTSTSSRILVFTNFQASVSGDIAVMFQFVRGSTAISIGDAAGNRTRASASLLQSNITEQLGTFSFHFLDSPATTSATTYKVQTFVNAGTMYVGRTGSDSDLATRPRTASTITVMEISA